MPLEFLDEPLAESAETPTGRSRLEFIERAGDFPEQVRARLRKPTGSLDEPRVSTVQELAGGIRDIGSLRQALSSDPMANLIKLGGGALRIAGAPLAEPLDWLGREAGRATQDVLLAGGRRAGLRDPSRGVFGGAVAGASSLVDAAAQIFGIPTLAKLLSLPVEALAALRRSRPEYLSKASQVEHMAEVAEKGQLAAQAARERAVVPTGELGLMEEQVPALQQAAKRAAIEAESTPVTTAQPPQPPTVGPALALKEETGQFFGGAVARERQKAQSVFEKAYGDVRRSTAGIEYDTADVVATADDILKGAGLARKIQPTKAEALAGRTKAVLLPKGTEDAIAEAETVGRQAALPNSTLEGIIDSLIADSKTATFNDLQVLRSRTRGAIRGFKEKGDFDTARRLEPLEAAYTNTIETGLPKNLVGNLRAADELYASEFIPKFGFESPASKLAGVASEDVITKLFPTKGQVEGITKPSMTKTAVGAPEWERLSNTFWRQKILEPAMTKQGGLDFAAVKANMAKYKPETLAEASGYKEINAIVDKFDEAEALTAKQIADWKLKTGVKAEIAKGRLTTLEEAIAGKKKQVTQLGKEVTAAEQSVLSAQKTIEGMTFEENSLTQTVLRDFATKSRWVGAAGILYPSMRGALQAPQFVTGLGLLFGGEVALKLLTSGRGRALFEKLMRVSGTSMQAAVLGGQIGAFYRSIAGTEPLEEERP